MKKEYYSKIFLDTNNCGSLNGIRSKNRNGLISSLFTAKIITKQTKYQIHTTILRITSYYDVLKLNRIYWKFISKRSTHTTMVLIHNTSHTQYITDKNIAK